MTCDITATVLADVCPNVGIEPLLQTFPMLNTRHASAITDDSARLNVGVNGFWGSNRHQSACLDVKFFTLTLHQIAIHNPRPAISNPTGCKREHMNSVSMKSSMVLSPPLFSLHQGEWGRLPLCSI